MRRNQFILLIGLLLSTASLFAQSSNSYYTILVGTFTGNRPENYNSVEKLGFLFAKERPNQVFDVYLGGYDTANEAAVVLDQVHKAGFSAAKIQQYVVRDNQSVASIQIASFEAKKPVNWNRYQVLSGDLFVVPNDEEAKLLTGFYPTIEAAKKELPRIQSLGFPDAFVRTVHPTFLHQVGGFETGTPAKEVNATAQIGPKKTNVPVSKPMQRPQPTFLPVDYQLSNPNPNQTTAVPGVTDNRSNSHAAPNTGNPAYAAVPPPSTSGTVNNPNARPAGNSGNGQGQFKWDNPPASNPNPGNLQAKSPNQIPASYGTDQVTYNPPPSNTPNVNPPAYSAGTVSNPNYNYGGTSTKGGNLPPAQTNAAPQNNYNAPVAIYRASVKDLQQALAQEGSYRNPADGYYNPTTDQAYRQFSTQNRMMARYTAVAKMRVENEGAATGQLNAMLNQLDKDANPVASLARINHPLSKAYMAYHSFTTRGPGFEANNYMNGAIREVFASRNVGNQISFDTRAAYAYTDLRQFILHLYYLHAAMGDDYPLPCWLNDKHPNESAEAQTLFNASSSLPLPTQACDESNSDPQNGIVLQLLAEDIGVEKVNEGLLKQAAEHRKQLYAGRIQLSAAEQTQLDGWSAELMNKLGIWSAQDPLHNEMVQAFRVVFYQTQVDLENHFMRQGMPVPSARYLALATLHTLVNPYLQRFG